MQSLSGGIFHPFLFNVSFIGKGLQCLGWQEMYALASKSRSLGASWRSWSSRWAMDLRNVPRLGMLPGEGGCTDLLDLGPT